MSVRRKARRRRSREMGFPANNNNTKSQVLDGAENDSPKIIEVHGVTEDNSGQTYVIEKMGNILYSAEEDPNTTEQQSPLTQSEQGNTSALNQSVENDEEDQSKVDDTKDLDEADETDTFVTANNGANTAESENDKDVTKPKENDIDEIVPEPIDNVSKDENGTKEENGHKDENGTKDENGSKDENGTKGENGKDEPKTIDENGTTEESKLEGSNNGNAEKKVAAPKKKEDEIVVDIVGKDDIDAASVLSLFMDRKDFRYYFQHPYLRMIFSYLVVFLNFFIYAEDPVAHSRKECMIPMIGNDFAFVTNRYPPNGWSLLKVVLWLTGLVIGLFVGKLFIHGFLFNKLFRLKMFTDDQGSWMVMFMCSLISIFVMSLVYNLFLMIGGDATADYRISDLMGVNNYIFTKAAACGTWCGDFFTAWMVTDIMLQEKLYPDWAKPVRKWWKRGYNRMILFWIVVVICWFIVIFVIATDYIQWDKLNRGFMPTNELSRAFLASFILVFDLCIVMQDWDFPHFVSAIDIKLPGLNTAHITFQIPKCLKRETWKVHITGKWFSYGMLFLVMILDLNMWKNQIFYAPYDYGQYTGPEGRIYTVQDDYSLENFNKTLTTYTYRSVTINPDTNQTYLAGDTKMNTKYLDHAIALKGIAFVPSIIAFIVFGILIWQFGRFIPTEENPYAGRLKKRIRKRLSFRMPWKRREEVNRKIHAVPKLLFFKTKGPSGVTEEITEIPTKGFASDNDDKDIEESIKTTVHQK